MSRDTFQDFYDSRWENREHEDFFSYERNRELVDFFPKTARKEKVLDVGCGNGTVAHYLFENGYQVLGIDVSKDAVDQAKKLGIGKFFQGNVEEGLPFPAKKFDVVFLGDILEHLFNPAHVLREAKRVLKPKGRIVVSCPNMGFLVYRWHYLKTGEIPLTEGHSTEPWNTGHIRFYSVLSLGRMLSVEGFRVSRVHGAHKAGLFQVLSRIWPGLFSSIIIVEGKLEE